MKPTQQDIIGLARQAGIRTCPDWLHGVPESSLVKLVELALERFGAGGREPVAHSVLYQHVLSRRWEIKWVSHPVAGPLYAHPSAADLRAEYLRGLEDALSVAVDAVAFTGGTVDTEAHVRNSIEALKGKQ